MFTDVTYANTEAVEHAVEASPPASVFASLGLNAQLFAFQFINFAVVAAVVWWLILKPLTKKMSERQRIIEESLDNAKKIEENLRRGERDYQQKIDVAKVEANKILEKAGVETVKLAEEGKVKAKKEIEVLIEQAKRNIRIEKEAVAQKLKEETVGFVAAALEKILGEKIDKAKDKELIEETLKGLK